MSLAYVSDAGLAERESKGDQSRFSQERSTISKSLCCLKLQKLSQNQTHNRGFFEIYYVFFSTRELRRNHTKRSSAHFLHNLHYASIPPAGITADVHLFRVVLCDNRAHNSFPVSLIQTLVCVLSRVGFPCDNFRQNFHNRSQKTANFAKSHLTNSTVSPSKDMWISPMTSYLTSYCGTTVHTTHFRFLLYTP